MQLTDHMVRRIQFRMKEAEKEQLPMQPLGEEKGSWR